MGAGARHHPLRQLHANVSQRLHPPMETRLLVRRDGLRFLAGRLHPRKRLLQRLLERIQRRCHLLLHRRSPHPHCFENRPSLHRIHQLLEPSAVRSRRHARQESRPAAQCGTGPNENHPHGTRLCECPELRRILRKKLHPQGLRHHLGHPSHVARRLRPKPHLPARRNLAVRPRQLVPRQRGHHVPAPAGTQRPFLSGLAESGPGHRTLHLHRSRRRNPRRLPDGSPFGPVRPLQRPGLGFYLHRFL